MLLTVLIKTFFFLATNDTYKTTFDWKDRDTKSTNLPLAIHKIHVQKRLNKVSNNKELAFITA